MSDEDDSGAFWDHMQRTTGSRSSSWATFSAIFETYLRNHYPDEMSQLPSTTRAEAEMILRYAFDRGSPARSAEGEHVTPRHLALFLKRFGPMRSCILKAARSLFDASGCLVPWFHGERSREQARSAIIDWEASHCGGRIQPGVFLFRYSDRQPSISFLFRRKRGSTEIFACLIHNGPSGYTLPDMDGSFWGDLQEFLAQNGSGEFVHPVPSALYFECKEEINARRRTQTPTPTREDLISGARQLYIEAQALVIKDIGTGLNAMRILGEALDLVEKVGEILGELEESEPKLQVKALRLEGDILWRLDREEEAVSKFQQCLSVVEEAEQLQNAVHDGSPVATASVLSHVHQLLAEYFLRQGLLSEGLDHFSELVACTTDEDARRQLGLEFRRTHGFRRATAGITRSSVEDMLEEAISFFRRKDYEPAGAKFEKVLRDARCIGEGKVEARALGNLATVDYKTHRIPQAIRRYRVCVQLLRQQGNEETERKILNYLILCCIEAQRWATAKLFHDQLSKLAVSEENIRVLRRLQERIEEGVALHARQQGGTAPVGRICSGGGNTIGDGSSDGGSRRLSYAPSKQQGAAATGGRNGGSLFHGQGRSPLRCGVSNANGQHGGAAAAGGAGRGDSFMPLGQQGVTTAGGGGSSDSRFHSSQDPANMGRFKFDGELPRDTPSGGGLYAPMQRQRPESVQGGGALQFPIHQHQDPTNRDRFYLNGQQRGGAPSGGGRSGFGGVGDDFVMVSPDPSPPPSRPYYGSYTSR